MPPVSESLSKPTAAPERSLVQRMEALQRANDIRTRRAQLIAPSKTVGGLSERQRRELVALMRRR
jgi:hypothetical protein